MWDSCNQLAITSESSALINSNSKCFSSSGTSSVSWLMRVVFIVKILEFSENLHFLALMIKTLIFWDLSLQVIQDHYFPADLLLLASTNADGVCYIEVKSYDLLSVECIHYMMAFFSFKKK